MEDVYIKLDEIFNLLDQYPSIENLKKIKKKITEDEIEVINHYRLQPSVLNKKKK